MKRSHVFIGILICLMFIGAIVALFRLEPPPGAREPLLILIGSLAAAFGAVVQYWFGSSSGSAHKNELLAASVPAEGKT
jgi:predicted CDP-diglyceride synthetase/phosphatidate cytidylyltransferase